MKKTAALGMACAVWAAAQSSDSARDKLIQYLDRIAARQLAERARAVARIQTRAAAERRTGVVRDKILALIGGLPPSGGPPAVKQFGAPPRGGVFVEKLGYHGLPGFG